MTEQPALETGRLVLEPATAALHARELWELFADEELHRFVPFTPPTLEEQEARCLRWEKRGSPDGAEIWLNWAARERESGRVVAHFQAGIPKDGVATLGYVVARAAQGRGLATEGMTAVVECLRSGPWGARVVQASADPRNEPSHRLARRLGMTPVAIVRGTSVIRGAAADDLIFLRVFPEAFGPLVTDRLILRRWRPGDLDALAAICADPRVMEFFRAPFTRETTEEMMTLIEERISRHGFGFWAAELRETRELAGFIGLNVPGQPLPFSPCVEIGWRLAHRFWGQGLAVEGARACLRHGFRSLGLPEVVSFTTAGNARSRRVMEKLGMVRDVGGDFDHPALPEGHALRRHVLYRLAAPGR